MKAACGKGIHTAAMKKDRRYYTMERSTREIKRKIRRRRILMAIVATVILGGGIAWTEIEIAEANRAVWTDSYPMANQHIEWSYYRIGGAGK